MPTDDQRTEDLLREALSAIARSVSPAASAWARIERAMERHPERRRQGYVSRASLVLLSLGLSAASIAGLWAVFRGASRDQPLGAGPQNLEPMITARVAVDESITGLAAAPSSLWVTAIGRPEPGSGAPCEGNVYGIDPDRNAVTMGVPVDFWPTDVVWGFGSVWLGGFSCTPPDAAGGTVEGIVARLDPGSGKLAAEARIGRGELVDLAVGAGSLWAARNPDAVSGEIVRVDANTMEITARLWLDAPVLGLEDTPVDALAASGDAVFILAGGDPTKVLRLEPSTMETSTLVRGTWAFAVAGGDLWAPIADSPGTTNVAAQRFDAETGAPLGAPIGLGDTTFFPFAVGEDGVWFVGGRRNVVVARLNTSLLTVDEEIPVSSSGDVGAVFDPARGVIWIADRRAGTVLRIDLQPTA